MKNNSLIITAVGQRAALRPGVTLLLSVSSRAENDLMQKLRAKFCQVTRKMPLDTLTHLQQNCLYGMIYKKYEKQVAPSVTGWMPVLEN